MLRTALFVCFLSALAVQPLASQVRIDGIVIDDATGEPIPGARVRLNDGWAGRPTRNTDSIGNFTLNVTRLGRIRVQVRSPGYEEVSGVIYTDAFPYLNVELRMRKGAELMAPVTILARSQMIPPEHMLGFHERLRNRLGAYVTREQVEAVRPGYISDMMLRTPGVAVRRAGEDRFLFARRFAEGSRTQVVECPLRVLVDAEVVNTRTPSGELLPATIDYTVDQTMVDGIEIYVNPAAIPAEFRDEAAQCGAVVIWTRNPRPGNSSVAATRSP